MIYNIKFHWLTMYGHIYRENVKYLIYINYRSYSSHRSADT